MKIVLASSSRQRKLLLESEGIKAEVRHPEVEEKKEGKPEEIVVKNALRKAKKAFRNEDEIVIAGDSIAYRGKPLLKPTSKEEAQSMLKAISNKWVDVYTATAVMSKHYSLARLDTAKVKIKGFDEIKDKDDEKRLGRAGAFSFEDIEVLIGSLYVVLGLNVDFIKRMMKVIERRI